MKPKGKMKATMISEETQNNLAKQLRNLFTNLFPLFVLPNEIYKVSKRRNDLVP